MNIQLQPLGPHEDTNWQVRMNEHVITFRTERQARAFVATLEARLAAPHVLPPEPDAARGERHV